MAERERGLAEAAETVVRRVRGVRAARVETDADGAIRLVHVLGSPDRTARVIAGDVVAALAADLGVELEPRQVRVASQQPTGAEGPAEAGRVKFVGLSVSVGGQAAEARVRLEHDGLIHEGIATGAPSQSDRLELVADAALRAVEMVLRAERLFSLDTVGLARIGKHDVALAVVTVSGRDDLLVGSSLIRDDRREAVVRGVLEALNRLLSGLTAP